MAEQPSFIDKTRPVRAGEELNQAALQTYLADKVTGIVLPLQISQFPGGHSNLTYLLTDAAGREMVLRRPPLGANIATAHDMGREYTILQALHPHFSKVPQPLAMDETGAVLGAPFYLMERVSGVILRGSTLPTGMQIGESEMRSISEALVNTLVDIHALTPQQRPALGHPEGYVRRQVEGWSERYLKSHTDAIDTVDFVASWLANHIPPEQDTALIHNDFKYDNLILDAADWTQVRAVLDWEMATVGDPLMDLGTTLSYWLDPDDPEEIRMLPFGPTIVPGNLSRLQVAEHYAKQSGRDLPNLVFYYAFGLFKTAVVAQQIYARFNAGLTSDSRFASMIFGVHLLTQQAQRAIKAGRIHQLG